MSLKTDGELFMSWCLEKGSSSTWYHKDQVQDSLLKPEVGGSDPAENLKVTFSVIQCQETQDKYVR